jgi:hypothetical protein
VQFLARWAKDIPVLLLCQYDELTTQVDDHDKQTLRRQYQQLNPAALKRELRRLQKQLFALATKKPRKSTRSVPFNIKPFHVKPRPTL